MANCSRHLILSIYRTLLNNVSFTGKGTYHVWVLCILVLTDNLINTFLFSISFSPFILFSGISCDKPDTVPFSRVKGKSYLYEDVLVYSCRRGYHNVGGTLSRTCTSGGNWTGETPICEREYDLLDLLVILWEGPRFKHVYITRRDMYIRGKLDRRDAGL